jgi:hypothetical protein
VVIEDEEFGAVSPEHERPVTPHSFPALSPTPPPPPAREPADEPVQESGPAPKRKPVGDDDDEDEDEDEKDLSEDEERMMLIARLKILKRGWQDIDVSDYDSKTVTLKRLRKIYKMFKARVFAEECSGGYKKWLIAGFVLIEVICVRILKIDMSGFTVNQISAMASYNDLLIELAEKYGSSYKSYFPVEARLIFAMSVNAVIFFILKNFLGDANSDTAKGIASALNGSKGEGGGGMSGILGSVMNMLTGGPPKPSGESLQPPAPRRRRKGVEPVPA